MTCAIAQPRLTGYDAFVLSSRDYGVRSASFIIMQCLSRRVSVMRMTNRWRNNSSMPDAFIWLSLDEDLP